MTVGDLPLYLVTIACLAAVGLTSDLARRRRNKKYLLLAVLPAGWLTYVAGFLIFRIAIIIYRHLAEIAFGGWTLATYYFWERGNEYKRQTISLQEQLSMKSQNTEATN